MNIIEPGKNYGWPIATFGREYTGPPIGDVWREGTELPYTTWTPSIGLSGLLIYTGDRLPGWRGNFFVGGLSGQTLVRLGISERGPVGRETLLNELRLRIRDVRQGADGLIYVVTDENPGGILRIEPAQGTSGVD
jgi:glucose/arabinose dehydrogenase